MFCKNLSVISLALFVFIGNTAFAGCPSADVTGDCFVDLEDFAVMAKQWLTTDPNVPDDMVYIPDGEFEMGDHHGDGFSEELPVHEVLIDSFFMSRFEITNQQYCDYLNDANSLGQIKVDSGIVYASSDSSNSYPYCDTSTAPSYSQIDYSDGVFSVRTKGGRNMSNDPIVYVSWYGSVAYCNWRSSTEGYESCYNLTTWVCDFSKHGYRLATEAEWEYAARGGLSGKRFPWSDPNISHNEANYYSWWSGGGPYYSYDVSLVEGYHPDWDDWDYPYTSVVGSFASNGYGLYDMAGNVRQWCHDWYDSTYYSTSPYPHVNPKGPVSGTYRVLHGGSWNDAAGDCRVACRYSFGPDNKSDDSGFRIVLDLN
ncbi:MAG: formylglycine-generating enzyme family protein [Planctomycetota bacterium]|jgi:formylglycine-generating enzyme required for sulfatase activity